MTVESSAITELRGQVAALGHIVGDLKERVGSLEGQVLAELRYVSGDVRELKGAFSAVVTRREHEDTRDRVVERVEALEAAKEALYRTIAKQWLAGLGVALTAAISVLLWLAQGGRIAGG